MQVERGSGSWHSVLGRGGGRDAMRPTLCETDSTTNCPQSNASNIPPLEVRSKPSSSLLSACPPYFHISPCAHSVTSSQTALPPQFPGPDAPML